MWDDPKQLNAVTTGLLVLAAVLIGWGVVVWAVRQPVFEVREVVVTRPLVRVNPAHLEAIIHEEFTGTLFTMNLERSRDAISQVPWVRKVTLRRQWPHRLELAIEEQVPFARWNDYALVNTQGEVFIADYQGELPQFDGPDGRALEVATRFNEWGAALAPLGLALRAVEMSPRGSWKVVAARDRGTLTIEIGREEPQERLDRFISLYGKTVGVLAKGGTRIDYVDLRYRNGFAARVPGFKERAPKRAA